jgi:hypothetical protein
MCSTPCLKHQAVLAVLAADVAMPAAVVAGCWARGCGKGDSVWANAQGSHWHARVGDEEGKDVQGECPGDVE